MDQRSFQHYLESPIINDQNSKHFYFLLFYIFFKIFQKTNVVKGVKESF